MSSRELIPSSLSVDTPVVDVNYSGNYDLD